MVKEGGGNQEPQTSFKDAMSRLADDDDESRGHSRSPRGIHGMDPSRVDDGPPVTAEGLGPSSSALQEGVPLDKRIEELMNEKLREFQMQMMSNQTALRATDGNMMQSMQMMMMAMMQKITEQQPGQQNSAASNDQQQQNQSAPTNKKIEPGLLRLIEKAARENEESLIKLVRAQNALSKSKKEIEELEQGRYPSSVRMYSSPWNIPTMTEAHSPALQDEHEITIRIPGQFSRIQACRHIHRATMAEIRAIEHAALEKHAADLESVAGHEGFLKVVNDIQPPEMRMQRVLGPSGVDVLNQEYVRGGPVVREKASELWRSNLKKAEKMMIKEEEEAKKKEKQEVGNFKQLEEALPEQKIREYVEAKVKHVLASVAEVEDEGEQAMDTMSPVEKEEMRREKEKKRAEMRRKDLEESRALLASAGKKFGGRGKGRGKGKTKGGTSGDTHAVDKSWSKSWVSPGSRQGHNPEKPTWASRVWGGATTSTSSGKGKPRAKRELEKEKATKEAGVAAKAKEHGERHQS